MSTVKQFQVTFDCAEPERVARFWCKVLGYVVQPPPEGFATWADFDRALPPERQGSAFACVDPAGVGPRLFSQRVPDSSIVGFQQPGAPESRALFTAGVASTDC
jgi:Glyoxalase-like domain